MTGRDEISHQTMFRDRWRERQSASRRWGGLLRQPAWINLGIIGLGVLLALGLLVALTVTVEQTTALPAAARGKTASAVRTSGPTPAVGSAVQFRDMVGTVTDAVVTEVDDAGIIAELTRPVPPSAGQLLLPAGRQRLTEVLAPRLG